jgi:hypothetical protein
MQEKITAATAKHLLNSLTFVSFASFAVQSYQSLGSFFPLAQNKCTHLGCSLSHWLFLPITNHLSPISVYSELPKIASG